jgi:hypothetical protein
MKNTKSYPREIDGKWWTEDMADTHHCHTYFIDNYVHKITRKWAEKQGIEIKTLDDFCEEGRKEIDDWYAEFPLDYESIKRITEKNVTIETDHNTKIKTFRRR